MSSLGHIPTQTTGSYSGGPGFHGGHVFSDTVYHKKKDHRGLFNFWLILLTAGFFFIILSWYNFGLSLYNMVVKGPLPSGTTYEQQIYGTLGFAIIWTLLVFLCYYLLNKNNFLSGKDEPEFHVSAKEINRGDVDFPTVV